MIQRKIKSKYDLYYPEKITATMSLALVDFGRATPVPIYEMRFSRSGRPHFGLAVSIHASDWLDQLGTQGWLSRTSLALSPPKTMLLRTGREASLACQSHSTLARCLRAHIDSFESTDRSGATRTGKALP
jgi:hypothetical protein